MQKIAQLRAKAQFPDAIALASKLAGRIKDHGSAAYEDVLLLRASCWYDVGDEHNWRQDLAAVATSPRARANALAAKASYLVAIGSPESLKEARLTLDAIDRRKLALAYRWTVTSAEYELASRSNNRARQLELALTCERLAHNAYTAAMVARSYARLGQARNAESWLQRILARSGNDVESLVSSANVLMAGGYMDGSEKLCVRAKQLDPGSASVSFLQASLADAQHKPKHEVERILLAMDDRRLSAAAKVQKYERLSDLSIEQKHTELARRYATEADKTGPNITNWSRLGLINITSGHYNEAERWYQKCIASSPQTLFFYAQLAESKARHGQIQKAIELCTYVLGKDPNSLTALKLRSKLYFIVEDFEKATADCERLQKLEPDKDHSPEVVRGLAIRYSQNPHSYYLNMYSGWDGIDEKRLARLNQQVQLTTDNQSKARLLQEQARLEIVLGQYDKAYAHAQASLACGNRTYHIHSLAAAALFGLHRQDEARNERQLAVDLHHQQRQGQRHASESRNQ